MSIATVRSPSAGPSWSAARKLFVPASSSPSSRIVPGVTMRVTSRRTTPLAALGSSTWSTTTQRWPTSTSRLIESRAAWIGNPAIGMGVPSPLFERLVSVMPRSRAARSACSKNSS